MKIASSKSGQIRNDVNQFVDSIAHFQNLSDEERIDAFSVFLEGVVLLDSYDMSIINLCFQASGLKVPLHQSNYLFDSCIKENKYNLVNRKYSLERFYKSELNKGLFVNLELEKINSDFFDLDLLDEADVFARKYGIEMVHSFEHGLYNACSVMARKLIEILIISTYETSGRSNEIKDDENFHMLGKLIGIINSDLIINLGRESKEGLVEIKSLGDRAAHNRRYLANKKDLLRIKPILRLLIQELIGIINK